MLQFGVVLFLPTRFLSFSIQLIDININY